MEPSLEPEKSRYDCDPDGLQLGMVAIERSNVMTVCEDSVVLIAELTSLAISLPKFLRIQSMLLYWQIEIPNSFSERIFLVLDVLDKVLIIRNLQTKKDLPPNSKILGGVILCQIPWIPSIKPTKSEFIELDKYF